MTVAPINKVEGSGTAAPPVTVINPPVRSESVRAMFGPVFDENEYSLLSNRSW
jgi:hypothetical protein